MTLEEGPWDSCSVKPEACSGQAQVCEGQAGLALRTSGICEGHSVWQAPQNFTVEQSCVNRRAVFCQSTFTGAFLYVCNCLARPISQQSWQASGGQVNHLAHALGLWIYLDLDLCQV